MMTERLKGFLKQVEPWRGVAALIVAIVVGFYGAAAWVHSSARNAVLDEKFLATLAARVRPTCIFNSSGAIEADLGAGEYIEDIRVIPAPQIYGFEILVKARRHLAYAPLVSGVNVDLLPQTATRGRLHDWAIVLSPQSTVSSIITEAPMDPNKVYRFRLEILH